MLYSVYTLYSNIVLMNIHYLFLFIHPTLFLCEGTS